MRNRTFFTALLVGALTVAGCSTVASPDTYGNPASVTAEATSEDTGAGTSSSSSGSDATSTSSSGSSDTDQGSDVSSGANFSEDLSLGIEPAPASEVEAYGMMHCCIKFNKKCMCYSTIDGDCSVCFPIKN